MTSYERGAQYERLDPPRVRFGWLRCGSCHEAGPSVKIEGGLLRCAECSLAAIDARIEADYAERSGGRRDA